MKREREFSEDKLCHKKQKTELKQFSLIDLPREIIINIFDDKYYQRKNLEKRIKFFLTLRLTCKHINELLTAEQIGQFCTLYDQETKDNELNLLVRIMNDESYEKLHFPFLVLRSAKANPNKNFFYYPTFFYAKTTKCAQLLIDYGADVYKKDKAENLNVLWYLIDGYYATDEEYATDEVKEIKKNSLDLFQFYIEKGVDPKARRPLDNACLFHLLAKCCYKNNDAIKFAEILFNKIPNFINVRNRYKNTPLDIAIAMQDYHNYQWGNIPLLTSESNKIKLESKNLQNFIIFLRNRGAKTARELRNFLIH